jgi:hypothetical protein
MINFDNVSTQTIIDIIKSNSLLNANYLVSSPKSARMSNSVSVLSQSLPFKQHFKNTLRIRKEAAILGYTTSSTPEWGLHGGHPSNTPSVTNILSNHLIGMRANPIRYASPETSIEEDPTKLKVLQKIPDDKVIIIPSN